MFVVEMFNLLGRQLLNQHISFLKILWELMLLGSFKLLWVQVHPCMSNLTYDDMLKVQLVFCPIWTLDNMMLIICFFPFVCVRTRGIYLPSLFIVTLLLHDIIGGNLTNTTNELYHSCWQELSVHIWGHHSFGRIRCFSKGYYFIVSSGLFCGLYIRFLFIIVSCFYDSVLLSLMRMLALTRHLVDNFLIMQLKFLIWG